VGVVQVGRSIAAVSDTLDLVRALLLLLAVLATLGAVAGGLFLANRALAPARLAFARQQTFIADASHQLRTPLALLRASAELLLRHRNRFDSDDAELLEDIVVETEHLDRLTSNLLTLARLDARQPHFEHEVFDLSTLVADVVRRVATLAAEKNVALIEDYEAKTVLVGDEHAVEEAALILVENAIKYTPPGGMVTLRTRSDNGHASLIVDDTGVGIPPAALKRLGERFYRGDPQQARATEGAGLGLAIASGIARAHGGSVQITNTEPHGARATLTLATTGPKT
jgi:signal transduction histidine kinase